MFGANKGRSQQRYCPSVPTHTHKQPSYAFANTLTHVWLWACWAKARLKCHEVLCRSHICTNPFHLSDFFLVLVLIVRDFGWCIGGANAYTSTRKWKFFLYGFIGKSLQLYRGISHFSASLGNCRLLLAAQRSAGPLDLIGPQFRHLASLAFSYVS